MTRAVPTLIFNTEWNLDLEATFSFLSTSLLKQVPLASVDCLSASTSRVLNLLYSPNTWPDSDFTYDIPVFSWCNPVQIVNCFILSTTKCNTWMSLGLLTGCWNVKAQCYDDTENIQISKIPHLLLTLLKRDTAKQKFPNKKSSLFNRQQCSLCILWNINMQTQLLKLSVSHNEMPCLACLLQHIYRLENLTPGDQQRHWYFKSRRTLNPYLSL